MSSYGAKGTRTPNNRLQRTVHYAARRTGAMGYVPDLHKIWVGPPISSSWRYPTNSLGSIATPSSWKRRPKPSATRHHGPMMAWLGSPKSTSSGRLNCWSRQQTLSAATRPFAEAATCKSSSPKSTSWAGCIGNGCPIWMASKTLYACRVRNPRHWSR